MKSDAKGEKMTADRGNQKEGHEGGGEKHKKVVVERFSFRQREGRGDDLSGGGGFSALVNGWVKCERETWGKEKKFGGGSVRRDGPKGHSARKKSTGAIEAQGKKKFSSDTWQRGGGRRQSCPDMKEKARTGNRKFLGKP